MNAARIWLLVVLLGIHIAVAAWDIWAVASGRPDDTVSHTFLDWSTSYPIFAFVFGIVCGHVFWPQFRANLP